MIPRELNNSDLQIRINKTQLPLLKEMDLVEDVDYMLGISVSVDSIITKGDQKIAVLKYNGGEYDLLKVKYES